MRTQGPVLLGVIQLGCTLRQENWGEGRGHLIKKDGLKVRGGRE